MGATIIISFLSLMSFADFLRVLWQQPPGDQQEEARGNDGADGENNEEEADGNATDNRIIEFIERKKKATTIENTLSNDDGSTIDYATTREPSEAQQHYNDSHTQSTDQDGVKGEEGAALLRDLAMEREARRQIDDGERDLAGIDDDQMDRDFDQIAPLADDTVDVPRRVFEDGEEFDSESDNGDANENEDDEEAWMDNDDDDNDNEDDAIPLFEQPGAEPMDDGVAFDPMDPVLQDDQVVSAIM
jgi:hypothetical protein